MIGLINLLTFTSVMYGQNPTQEMHEEIKQILKEVLKEEKSK